MSSENQKDQVEIRLQCNQIGGWQSVCAKHQSPRQFIQRIVSLKISICLYLFRLDVVEYTKLISMLIIAFK